MRRLYRSLYGQFSEHIQVRLTCYFLMILVPLLVLSLFAHFRSQSILERQVTDRTKGALASAVGYIDLAMRNVEELSELISTDLQFVSILDRGERELSGASIVEFSGLLKNVTVISSINPLIENISILHLPSQTLLSSHYGGEKIDNIEQYDWVQRTLDLKGGQYLFLPKGELAAVSDDLHGLYRKDSIALMRSMDLYNQQKKPYIVIISIKRDMLLKLIESLLPTQSAQIYLYAEDNRIVAGTEPGHTPPVWDSDEDAAVRTMPDTLEKRLMVRAKSPASGWSIVMTQPEAELYAQTRPLQWFTYAIIGVSVLLALWIAWIVYRSIASPLEHLMHGMRQVRSGNLDIRLANRRRDELGYVIESFNRMAAEQKQLIEGHYEQELRLSQTKLRMSRTELKFLQSQINPHFLYNTLDSIYWVANQYDAREIKEMVLNLSRFFRLSLNKGQEVFTLADTVEHLHYYVRIQQIRFSEQFAVTYDIAPDCREFPLLKLLLQPLVENAILHGLEKCDDQGELTISARREADFLLLGVTDNGAGFSAERLAIVQNVLGKPDGQPGDFGSTSEEGGYTGEGEVFGLKNVLARLRLYYGPEAGMTVESAEGVGTAVTLRIPYEQNEVSHESNDRGG